MLDPYYQKTRKPFSNKAKSNILQIPNFTYKDLKQKIGRPSTHRPKGKQNKKSKLTVLQQQKFPSFAIKFRNEAFQTNKNNDSFSPKKHVDNLNESFGRIKMNNKQCSNQKIQQKYEQHRQKQTHPIKFRNNQIFPDNKKFFSQFTLAIQKIFKSLDVFGRGRISQANINKWIPQSALYFLGGVFQKIRQQRLSLYYAEFESLCKPLLFESTEDDVRWFIEEVNGKQLNLVSINTGSEQKQQSPVQVRINYQTVQKQSQKTNKTSEKKNESKPIQDFQFSKVIQNINLKEKQLNIRLNSIKQKPKNLQSTNQLNQFSFFNSRNFPSSQIINHQPQFKQKPIQDNKYRNNQRKPIENLKSNEKQVPNFSFKLPKEAKQFTRINPKFDLDPHNFQQRFENFKQSHDKYIPAKTSRIVRQSVPKSAQSSISRRSSIDPQQTDRIDKLSSRLQQYIKFNKQKIERNKKFIRQNSLPQK